jgi:hypothetical protein
MAVTTGEHFRSDGGGRPTLPAESTGPCLRDIAGRRENAAVAVER